MSNENTKVSVYERLWKLWAMIGKMIMDGVRDPEKVAEVLQTIVDGVAGVKIYLKRLFNGESFAVGAMKSTKTFEESGFFPGGVYNENLLGTAKPTSAIKVVFDELIEDGKFPDFLGNTALELERRRLYRGHVIKSCETHRDRFRKDGYATFAVITKDDEPVKDDLSNVFVARVHFGGRGRLGVGVGQFSYDYVWGAEYQHRVVSPQQ